MSGIWLPGLPHFAFGITLLGDPRRRALQMVEELSKPKEGSQPIHFDSLYAKGLLAQFKVLLWRNNHVYWRWVALSTGTCMCSP